jgi:hypothetical protein
MKKVYNIHEDAYWVDAQGYPEGTKLKVLFDQGGVKTFLLQTPAGFNMAAHSHTHFEQHLVLQGEHTMNGQIYKQGTYRCYSPDEFIESIETKEGALILVMFHPDKT